MNSERTSLRLVVLRVLVLSLLATLAARLYYLQVLDQNKLTQTANNQHVREVILPAPRGPILDAAGRPLVDNRTSLVVSVDYSELQRHDDEGKAVLERLAPLVRVPAAELAKRITPCGKDVPRPCWNGSPYQPVPVATDTTPNVVLRIAEHQEDFPGVRATSETLRQYPGKQLAAHTLGYIGPVSQEELDNAAAAGRDDVHELDLVGRSGLERSYNSTLRGVDGIRKVKVDNRGTVVGLDSETAPVPGNALVTSLDRDVQALAEKALTDQITRTRATADTKNGGRFPAPSGAAVVVDPRTGRVLALATYPTFDPTVFVGGISQKDLDRLTSESAGVPMVSRATQGQFAPGSTFKLISSSNVLTNGQATTTGNYTCPGSVQVGNRTKHNFEGRGMAGAVNLRLAMAKSCDTIFYKFAMNAWFGDQRRVDARQKPAETEQRMARAYGFGSEPGLDVPEGEQTSGRITDRAFKQNRWEQSKASWCARAKQGHPEEPDPQRRAFLTQLDSENCTDGWRYRIGDHADLFIGQGETTVSPLQLAMAYSALANGGTLFTPTLGRAIVGPDGKVVKEIAPRPRSKVPVKPEYLAFLRESLSFTNGLGVSGQVAFGGFPLDKFPVGGKTGTAEVFGKKDTSWFASWGPVNSARFVVVGMVEQAGLGARAAAPMVRQIYEGLVGTNGKRAALPGGAPRATVPKVAPYGSLVPPEAGPSPSPSPKPKPTAGSSPTPGATPPAAQPSSEPTGQAGTPPPTPNRWTSPELTPALPPDRAARPPGAPG